MTISLTLGNTAFPFGDGLPRYAHPFGQGFLGPAPGAPDGGQLPAPFCCGHTVHLPFWFQRSIFLRRLQATGLYFALPRVTGTRTFFAKKGQTKTGGMAYAIPPVFHGKFFWSFSYKKRTSAYSSSAKLPSALACSMTLPSSIWGSVS